MSGNDGVSPKFLLARLARDGAVRWSSPVVLPGAVVGAWATFVASQAGMMVLAVAGPRILRIIGIGVLWDGSSGEPSDLFSISADRLLQGDVRSDLQNRTWIGLLVSSGTKWARVRLALPSGGLEDDTAVDEWVPDPGAIRNPSR